MNEHGETGALDDMVLRPGNQVWLYAEASVGAVGFGAIGITSWRIPDPRKSAWVQHPHILYVGVDVRFRGKPADVAPEERYASQIMRDLISSAKIAVPHAEYVSLTVHAENPSRRFHERFGFRLLEKAKPVIINGQSYVKMVRPLEL